MATIFSKIIKGDIPSYKIAEDDKYFAFLDINPLSEGHTLVIPKKETDYIFDLEDEQLAGLHLFAKRVAKAVERAVPCSRIGMAVVGLEVPHAHIHLVPINSIEDLSFARPRQKFTGEEFVDTAERIKKELK